MFRHDLYYKKNNKKVDITSLDIYFCGFMSGLIIGLIVGFAFLIVVK